MIPVAVNRDMQSTLVVRGGLRRGNILSVKLSAATALIDGLSLSTIKKLAPRTCKTRRFHSSLTRKREMKISLFPRRTRM